MVTYLRMPVWATLSSATGATKAATSGEATTSTTVASAASPTRTTTRGNGEPVGIGHTRPAKLQAKRPFGTQRDPSTHRDGAVFGVHVDDARAAHLEALPNRYVRPGPQVLPAQHSHRAGRRTGPGVLT